MKDFTLGAFLERNEKIPTAPQESETKTWKGLITYFLVFLFLGIGGIYGQCLPTVGAEICIDGDPSDWDVLHNTSPTAPTYSHTPDPFGGGVLDDQFTQGSKDFFEASSLNWTEGQTKAKNDIANAAAFIEDGYLKFAGDKTSNNGDSQIGFWFYLNNTSPQPDGSFAPEHAVGDLLVLINFTGGGSTPNLLVYQWVGGTDKKETNLEDVTASGIGFAKQNSGGEDVPENWLFPTLTYDSNNFFEGYLDLSKLPEGSSFCFSRFMVEGRSSQEVTASLDDFASGQFDVKPTVTVNSPEVCSANLPATITATPGSGLASDYNYSWTVPAGESDPGNVASFSASVAGAYSVIISYKSLSSIDCPSDSANGILTINQNPTVTVNSPTVCSADLPATITATPSPADSGGDYTYSWTVPMGVSDPGNVASFSASTAGSYSVTITDKTSTACTGSGSGTLTINQNPTVTVNSPEECEGDSAIITATPNPADSGGDYTYSWTVPAGVSDPGNVASFSASVAGTYSVTITDKTTTTCTGSGSGTLTLVPCCSSETAYAAASESDDRVQFCGNIKSNNWGWINGPYSYLGLDETLPLYAGAGGCDIDSGLQVGTINLSYNAGNIEVVYMLNDPATEYYQVNSIHVYIGCDDLPRFAGSPGQYPYKDFVMIDELTYKVIVPLADLMNGNPNGPNYCPEEFYLIAHAQVDVCEGTREPEPTASVVQSTQSIQAESLSIETVENDVSVSPVPFDEEINLSYDLNYTSDVTIEIFDFGGNLLKTVKERGVSKGSSTSIGVDFSIGANQMYLLRVSTDRETFVKQILSKK